MVLTGANLDAFRVHSETWAEQFRLAMSVNGGDIENATFSDYTLHFFSFFWKVRRINSSSYTYHMNYFIISLLYQNLFFINDFNVFL